MADQSITQLPVALNLTGNEQVPVVQNGVTKQASVSQIANAASPGKLITNVALNPSNYDLIFYYSDGTTSQVGPIPGFVSATIDSNGHLILTETTGATIDCGQVTGTSGYSGYSGFSGYSGTSGFSGISGYSGTSGYSGSGVSGYSGYSGTSGYSGVGTSGTSGTSGYSGFSGYSGTSGWSGISGYSGYSGIPDGRA